MKVARRIVFACGVMAALTIAEANATQQNSTGDGGTGGSAGGASGGLTCYMSTGGASGYYVGFEGDTLTPSMSWSLPFGKFGAMQIRFTTQGGDGTNSYDSGWQDVFGFGATLDGPNSGTVDLDVPDPNNSLDMSSGSQFTAQFTDLATGDSFTEEGFAYPADPITNTC